MARVIASDCHGSNPSRSGTVLQLRDTDGTLPQALEYSDVFPLIYLKIRLEGSPQSYRAIKHLLVDEMQDYAPVQYAVIARLFPCSKTILGDASQAVNPFSASSMEAICQVFPQADCVRLCKSYRSSYEITQFAQTISPNHELIAIERHGETPVVAAYGNGDEQLARIREQVVGFPATDRHTMAIICKTQAQAEQLHRTLYKHAPEVHLLTVRSTTFQQGLVVCAAHLAKGLEFDEVLIPDVDDQNYSSEMDRNLLYVACTRAMHRLTLTHTGLRSRFLERACN